jgi:hypothetical protein
MRPGLWVKSWRGWAQLDDIEPDGLSIMVTLRFADGTASTVARSAALLTCDQDPR